MSISRHLIIAKGVDQSTSSEKAPKKSESASEYEKLELDIKNFYSKTDLNCDDDSGTSLMGMDSVRESVCVLLHGALKVENMAALVLLNDDWFGFIYSYADSKKKSNLMLTVLPPGKIIGDGTKYRKPKFCCCLKSRIPKTSHTKIPYTKVPHSKIRDFRIRDFVPNPRLYFLNSKKLS